MSETSHPHDPPKVTDRVTRPLGVLPRHAQAWVISGIALVMVVIIAFSGQTPSPKTPESSMTTSATVVDPVQARIEEYRARIDEQARKLAAEQRQMAPTSEARDEVPREQVGPVAFSGNESGLGASSLEEPTLSAVARTRAELAADRLKRQYNSAFASPIVSTRRETPVTPSKGQAPAVPSKTAAPVGKSYRLLEGAAIETVLTNRLDGSYSGPVNCQVTTHVYSHDRDKLLIPQGSRVLGEVRPVDSFGQQRLAVAFHRLILPNGYSTTLDHMPGLNQLGETGLVDQIQRHYLQVFGVSMAIGAIAGLNQSTTRYGTDTTATDVYRQGVTTSLAQSSLNILDRYLNVLPTFTIREGHRIKVYLTADLSLPAYDPDFRPSDL